MCKRVLLVMMCLFLIVGYFAGCGSNRGDETEGTTNAATTKSSTGAEEEPVTITFWFPAQSDAMDAYFKGMAEEFTNSSSSITVEHTVLPTAGKEQDTKLNAALLSGTFPDVWLAYLSFMGTRAPRKELMDLGEYKDNWEDKDDIFESSYEMGKYAGVLYGMPFYPAPNIMVYRKDYFEEAGLDPEKAPMTWADLKEYAEKLTVRDDKGNVVRAGLDIPSIEPMSFMYPLMRQNGGGLIDNEGNVTLNRPENIEALEFIKELADMNVSIPYSNKSRQEYPFMKGDAAIDMFMLVTMIDSMVKNDPTMADKLGFGPALKNEKGIPSVFCGQRFFTIGADSDNPDDGWEFIKFMMSEEQFEYRMNEFNIPPLRKSVQKIYVNSAKDEYGKTLNQAVIDNLEYGKGNPVAPWFSLLTHYHNPAYEEAIYGKKTPEEAYNDAYENILKDWADSQ